MRNTPDIDHLLKDYFSYMERVRNAPKRHPLQKDSDLDIHQIVRGLSQGWKEGEKEIVAQSEYCQHMIAVIWEDSPPTSWALAKFKAENIYSQALAEAAELSTEISHKLKSRFVDLVAKNITKGKQIIESSRQALESMPEKLLVPYQEPIGMAAADHRPPKWSDTLECASKDLLIRLNQIHDGGFMIFASTTDENYVEKGLVIEIIGEGDPISIEMPAFKESYSIDQSKESSWESSYEYSDGFDSFSKAVHLTRDTVILAYPGDIYDIDLA